MALRHQITVLERRLPGDRPRILREYDMPPELSGRGLRQLQYWIGGHDHKLWFIAWDMWEVVLLGPVDEWFLELCDTDPQTANRVMEAIDHLAQAGPGLGRPLVDRIHSSRLRRLGVNGSWVRIPPSRRRSRGIFDRWRCLLLVSEWLTE